MNSFILLLLVVALASLLLRMRNLQMEKTRLKINIAETDLDYAQQIFEKMLNESEGLEINWEQSGIAQQKRLLESLNFEIYILRKKKKRYFFFYY